MIKYDGDWNKVMENHVRIKRLTLSEKDRIGIGTFQPKDEKNQDSTELTGDINYQKDCSIWMQTPTLGPLTLTVSLIWPTEV
jgi:predicted Ser/Thr protein kinase